jgi:hypothetical protein
MGKANVVTVEEEHGEWINSAVLTALDAIQGQMANKKRDTVLLVAFAVANGLSVEEALRDPRVCNRRIWYQKWVKDPIIKNAVDVCTARALEWRDSETARIESQATQARRKALAMASVSAVRGLEATALEVRGKDGIEASKTLLALSDDEMAARLVQQQSKAPIQVQTEEGHQVVKFDFSNVPTEILRIIAGSSPDPEE